MLGTEILDINLLCSYTCYADLICWFVTITYPPSLPLPPLSLSPSISPFHSSSTSLSHALIYAHIYIHKHETCICDRIYRSTNIYIYIYIYMNENHERKHTSICITSCVCMKTTFRFLYLWWWIHRIGTRGDMLNCSLYEVIIYCSDWLQPIYVILFCTFWFSGNGLAPTTTKLSVQWSLCCSLCHTYFWIFVLVKERI